MFDGEEIELHPFNRSPPLTAPAFERSQSHHPRIWMDFSQPQIVVTDASSRVLLSDGKEIDVRPFDVIEDVKQNPAVNNYNFASIQVSYCIVLKNILLFGPLGLKPIVYLSGFGWW